MLSLLRLSGIYTGVVVCLPVDVSMSTMPPTCFTPCAGTREAGFEESRTSMMIRVPAVIACDA